MLSVLPLYSFVLCIVFIFSPNLLHSSLSDVCLFQVTTVKLLISSLHLVFCLLCLYFIIPGLPFCYFNTSFIIPLSHNLSCSCPLFSFIVVKMCSTLVCSLIHDALFLSLRVMPNIILSIPQ